MKFVVPLTILAAVAVEAAAVPEADPWCTLPGQSCWKAKRAAKAAPAPVANPEADPWCNLPGQSCWKAKRSPEAAPNAEPWGCVLKAGARNCWANTKREAAPEAEAEPWCNLPGQSCWKAKRAAEAEAAANPDASAEPWCNLPGQSCWKVKRAAEAFSGALASSAAPLVETREADFSNAAGGAAYFAKRDLDQLAAIIALSQADAEAYYANLHLQGHFPGDTSETEQAGNAPEKRWCTLRGQSCWKHKRSEVETRDPEAHANDKRWCTLPGQSCWKAKRAAEAVISAIDNGALETRTTFNPEARVKREAEPWCTLRGQSCWKRDAAPEAFAEAACNGPSGACTLANRDLNAMYNVARNIVAANSE